MRRLLISFAIGILAFANGAPTEEESKVYSKSFNYDGKTLIYPVVPFWKNNLVYAVCESTDNINKKCKVYIESSNLDEHAVQSCDLNLKYTGHSGYNVGLFNAGNSKAVIATSNPVTNQFTLLIVNLKGCQIKEATLYVSELSENMHENFMVVPHEKDFDVICNSESLYHGNLYKATFDYEGKEIKAVASFPVKDLIVLQVESTNNGYLVHGVHAHSSLSKIYLVHDKENKSDTLFSDDLTTVRLSTEENKLGYCFHAPQKLVCKQYDADGMTKKIEVEVTVRKGPTQFIDVHNLDKGLLVLSGEYDDHRKTIGNVFIVQFDEHGNQGKHVNVDLKCNENSYMPYVKLYKNSNGQYCVASLCTAHEGSNIFYNTRCFFKTELF